MKRYIAMILAVVLICSLAACNSSPAGDSHGTESTGSTTEATECPHNFVADRTEDPTCEKEGYTLYVCTLCEAAEERDGSNSLTV